MFGKGDRPPTPHSPSTESNPSGSDHQRRFSRPVELATAGPALISVTIANRNSRQSTPSILSASPSTSERSSSQAQSATYSESRVSTASGQGSTRTGPYQVAQEQPRSRLSANPVLRSHQGNRRNIDHSLYQSQQYPWTSNSQQQSLIATDRQPIGISPYTLQRPGWVLPSDISRHESLIMRQNGYSGAPNTAAFAVPIEPHGI